MRAGFFAIAVGIEYRVRVAAAAHRILVRIEWGFFLHRILLKRIDLELLCLSLVRGWVFVAVDFVEVCVDIFFTVQKVWSALLDLQAVFVKIQVTIAV